MCAFRRRAHLPAGRYSPLAGDSLLIMSLSTIAWLPTGYTCHVRKSFVNGTITTTSTSSQSKDTPLVWGHIIISLVKLKGIDKTKKENNLAADRRWYFTAIKRPTPRVRRMGSFAWRGSKAFVIMVRYCNFFSQFLWTWGWGRFHREGWQEGVIRQGDNYWWRGVLASYCHNVIAVIINVVIVNLNIISCSSIVIVSYRRASSRYGCHYRQ